MEMNWSAFERAIPQLAWEMPVEVMKDFDVVLLFGKLAAVSPVELTVRRMASEPCFPVMEEEGMVLVRCYDSQLEPVLLRAKVTRSSGTECTMGEIEMIPYKTQRQEVRYPLCPPAELSVLDGAGQEPSQPCQLLNISAGGACILAGRSYAVGQALCLRIGPEGAYPCNVIRVTPRRGCCFEHGLVFGRLDRSQVQCLEEFLRDWFPEPPALS